MTLFDFKLRQEKTGHTQMITLTNGSSNKQIDQSEDLHRCESISSVAEIESRIYGFLSEQGITQESARDVRETRVAQLLGKRRAPVQLAHFDTYFSVANSTAGSVSEDHNSNTDQSLGKAEVSVPSFLKRRKLRLLTVD